MKDPRGTFEPPPPRRPEGYDAWAYVGGTGSGYGPPSERKPLGFSSPSRLVVVRGGYRSRGER